MILTNKYRRVPLDEIIVKRDERQRRKIDVSNLLDSVRQRGVYNPIVVTSEMVLVAGERRLEASRVLGLPDIPVRFLHDPTPIEVQIVELEENLKRQDLTWQESVGATAKLHNLFSTLDETWTQTKTAEAIGMEKGQLSEVLRVSRDINSPKIAGVTSLRAAYNILSRVDERRMGDALSEILEAGTAITTRPAAPVTVAAAGVAGQELPPPPATPAPLPESILNEDFLAWAAAYTGQPFNFIHCDFPYGINLFAGEQSGRDRQTTYNDSPDVYWNLIRGLCSNLDRVMSHSAHLMFWCSGETEIIYRTMEAFRELAPSLEFNAFPLIWHKTDNVGLLPDPKRGPRRVYETCLIASREDRLIVRATSNAYGAPTDKAHHTSTKPEPVLRQFMSMFIDEHTRMLDPTCGSGSSLRAAESLGACKVLGLEIDKEHCENAKSALRKFRALRKASSNG